MLSGNIEEKILKDLFRTAIHSATPNKILGKFLPEKPTSRTIIIGVGKAAASMAKEVENIWGKCEGIVVTRYGHGLECRGIKVLEAAHPFTDENGLNATDEIITLLSSLKKNDFVLCLISGGGSALLCKPRKGVSFIEKQKIFSHLFMSSASINEINIVRKHLSEIKGGQLSKIAFPAKVLSLIISDVSGDDPSDIASGITSGEITTGLDAIKIINKYRLDVSKETLRLLEKNSQVLTPNDQYLSRTQNIVIGTANKSLKASQVKAESLGFTVKYLGDSLQGEAKSLGVELAELAKNIQYKMRPDDKPIILLSGGECTVNVSGSGEGGPNAELALSAAITLKGQPGISLLAGDTDGIDGLGNAAGAIVTPNTIKKAKRKNLNPKTFLRNSDSHSFFKLIGDQVITGPTLTNVNDFRAFIIRYPKVI
ncbi:MAG: glycerate kinase [Paracoccaceae bacterium]